MCLLSLVKVIINSMYMKYETWNNPEEQALSYRAENACNQRKRRGQAGLSHGRVPSLVRSSRISWRSVRMLSLSPSPSPSGCRPRLCSRLCRFSLFGKLIAVRILCRASVIPPRLGCSVTWPWLQITEITSGASVGCDVVPNGDISCVNLCKAGDISGVVRCIPGSATTTFY